MNKCCNICNKMYIIRFIFLKIVNIIIIFWVNIFQIYNIRIIFRISNTTHSSPKLCRAWNIDTKNFIWIQPSCYVAYERFTINSQITFVNFLSFALNNVVNQLIYGLLPFNLTIWQTNSVKLNMTDLVRLS